MQTFRIHKNINLPPKSKYPFPKMEIGDTFYVPCNSYFRNLEQCKIHNAARRYREKHKAGFKVSTISATHNGKFVIAVQRTA